MNVQPFLITWAGLLVLLVAGLLLWWALHSKHGRTLLVLVACAILLGVPILYLTSIDRSVVVQVATASAANLLDGQSADTAITGPVEEEAQRPAWVDQPPSRNGGKAVFTVTAGPHATDELCQRELNTQLRNAVDAHIDSFIGQPGAGRRVGLSVAYIRDRLVKDQYAETVQASFGPMRNVHALVEIDEDAHRLIAEQYQQALMQARLGYTAGSFGLVLVVLATAFGYLKLDTLTKGYYSGRLKVAATAVILTAAAAAALAVRQADPAAQWPIGFPTRESPQFEH